MTALKKIISEFEGKTITTITYEGRPAWLASEVGQVLGYADNGGRLVTKVTHEWEDEFIENHDYKRVEGSELVELKRFLENIPGSVGSEELTPKSVGSRARHVLLLFEPGLLLSFTKTNKPIGRRLRRFLADEVIPQLARDGQYLPGREVVNNEVVGKSNASTELSAAFLREQRLAAWQEHQMRKSNSDAIKEMLGTLKSLDRIDEDTYAAYAVVAAEMQTEREMSALKPKTEDDWLSPSQIAELTGKTSQRIGLVISDLDIRGDKPGLCRPVINKAKGHDKQVVSYLYSPKAVQMILDRLDESHAAASGE